MAATKEHRTCAGHQSCKAPVEVWGVRPTGEKFTRYCRNHAVAVSLTLPPQYKLVMEDGSEFKPTRSTDDTGNLQAGQQSGANNPPSNSQSSGHRSGDAGRSAAGGRQSPDTKALPPGPEQQVARRTDPPAESAQSLTPSRETASLYQGAGTLTLTEQEAAILAQPWPVNAYQIRDDGEVYVGWQGYAERLTAAVGAFGWALVPLEKPLLKGNEVFVHYALFVRGVFIAEAVESHVYRATNRKVSYDAVIESAKSECLRRCCKGRVGDLLAWDRGFREQWKMANCTTVFRKNSGRMAWRRLDAPPFDDEGDPDRSSESEYKRPMTIDQEAKAHMDSMMGEGQWSDWNDDAREGNK